MQKTTITLKIKKTKNTLLFGIKTIPEIEQLFKKWANNQSQVSAKWYKSSGQAVNFYSLSDELERQVATCTENIGFPVVNEFSTKLMQGEAVNIGLLRIVGVSDGVELMINDVIGYDELRIYAEKLGTITKELYRNFLTDFDFKASIQFDI